TRGTWLRRLAKAANLQRVVQARGSFLISGRAAEQGRRWGRHRAPRALASRHIALSIFQYREFRITERGTPRNPRCPQNRSAHRSPRGLKSEWSRLAPPADRCWLAWHRQGPRAEEKDE